MEREADAAAIQGQQFARAAFYASYFDSFGLKKDTQSLFEHLKFLIFKSKNLSSPDFQTFCRSALFETVALVKLENDDHELSRSFDIFDDLFAVDYSCDKNTKADSAERLYPGAGARVQSSYSSIIQNIARLEIPANAHIVDLGSGYGRLGWVLGILRPDIYFDGYEFVETRVRIANQIAARLGIYSKVNFHDQDLSSKHFQIPAADIYYLYDPFTESTYRHVFKQLAQLSLSKNFRLLTKGHAGNWVEELFSQKASQSFEQGNLRVFEVGPEN